MTPLEALEAELCAEARALARRRGERLDGLESVTFRVDLDRETGLPRVVHCHEEQQHRILVGSAAKRRA